MNVLNLYACLGGNRYKWDEVADIQVTAVELDADLAQLYAERFPNDTVIVADAHEYLLTHYQDFDFIWSSPPCPTHSRARYWSIGANGTNPVYPDFKLYEEIVFLQHHFKGKYVVENVDAYYEPLINAKKRDRHLYWTNFSLPNELSKRTNSGVLNQKSVLNELGVFHDYDFRKYQGDQRILKIARNLVDYEAGKTILETAFGIICKSNVNQLELL
jgi:DNA (cytosine-5)-methyltransferase 1